MDSELRCRAARDLQSPSVNVQADDLRVGFAERHVHRKETKPATQVKNLAAVRQVLLDLFEKSDVDDLETNERVEF